MRKSCIQKVDLERRMPVEVWTASAGWTAFCALVHSSLVKLIELIGASIFVYKHITYI
ncbi:unnamed protein product [Cyberlindnera jadinii]|uniref:Uncharacterized protein n=1 Tax=Cyberlindnera jadinii (strain ATCC 18201 / CBS 1600 / BCRC 20928 / JCM 3617 / NBRC 0987 / NRRL Y-1542) TaxID=983966 RepID=A0A0H5BZB0_CYBJN|nr:unnamed protein product [Cyberlindnera jadinii]